jgi:hypothetical protein
VTRAPYRLFTDRGIYEREQRRIFRGRAWNFLGLEVKLPRAGDIKTTTIGETPVIVARDSKGAIHAMVNRCLKRKDNASSLTCVYHAWNYEIDGRLKSVTFRNGVRGQGGMPDAFDASISGSTDIGPALTEPGAFQRPIDRFLRLVWSRFRHFRARRIPRPRLRGPHASPGAAQKSSGRPSMGLEIENFTDDESNCDFCRSCISREMRVSLPRKSRTGT